MAKAETDRVVCTFYLAPGATKPVTHAYGPYSVSVATRVKKELQANVTQDPRSSEQGAIVFVTINRFIRDAL